MPSYSRPSSSASNSSTDNSVLSEASAYNGPENGLVEPDLVLPDRRAVWEWISDPEALPQERLGRRILYILKTGLVACPDDRHARRDQDHLLRAARVGPCRPLSSTCTLPSTERERAFGQSYAEKTAFFGLNRRGPHVPGHPRLERGQLPAAPRLRYLMTGRDYEPALSVANVCLHQDDARRPFSPPMFDVDSSLTLFPRLDVFQSAIHLTPTAQRSNLLKHSVHLRVKVQGDLLHLKDIPHLQFAVCHKAPVFLFFPDLYNNRDRADTTPTASRPKPFNGLPDALYQALWDGATWPALAAADENHARYHPPQFQAMVDKANATQREIHGNKQARAGNYNIDLHASHIPKFYAEFRRRLMARSNDGPNLAGFREHFFLYDRKADKSLYRRPTLTAALHDFWQDQNRDVGVWADPEQPPSLATMRDTHQFVDIAAEFAASTTLPYHATADPTVALARPCCQRNTLRFLYGDGEDKEDARDALWTPEGAGQGRDRPSDDDDMRWPRRAVNAEYPVHLLRDSVTVTSEPTRSNRAFVLGLRYVQSYSALKSTFDAKSNYPYTDPALVSLGYMDKDWQAINAAASVSHSRQTVLGKMAFSTTRTASALAALQAAAWRFEVRVSTTLAQAVQYAACDWSALVAAANANPLADLALDDHRAAPQGRGEHLPPAAAPQPPQHPLLAEFGPFFASAEDPSVAAAARGAFYTVPVGTIHGFLHGNIEKHLLVLDSIQELYGPDGTCPMGSIGLYALVMLALRHFVSPIPFQQAWMLTNPLPVDGEDGQRSPGLGLDETIRKRGFAFLPRVLFDWDGLSLRDGWVERLAIPEFRVRRNYPAVLSFVGKRSFHDQVLQLLYRGVARECQYAFLLEVLVQNVLEAFRETATEKLLGKNPLVDHYAARGGIAFRFHDLVYIGAKLGRTFSILAGNRAALKDSATYILWLFTDDQNIKYSRKHIENYTFRHLAASSRKAAAQTAPKSIPHPDRYFMALLTIRFYQVFPATPYPNSNGLLSAVNAKNGGQRPLLCHDTSPYRSPLAFFDTVHGYLGPRLLKRLGPQDTDDLQRVQIYAPSRDVREARSIGSVKLKMQRMAEAIARRP